MSEVKRYGHQQYNGKIWFEERDDGKFCSYDDYAALKAERDALAVLAEERRQFIVNGVEMGDILLPVIDGDPAIGIHERCLLKPKFAYDAYLNLVRAEGVEMFAAHQRAMIGNPHKNDAANSYAARSAVEYAAILRAGEPS